ncbi:MAG TPA: hypothetical protein ENJ09_12415 [Planctomycetes bacterium]|nr:hypothetical protein [Planctomycetota bacterium]
MGRLLLLVLAAAGMSGCLPSNVVAPEARRVRTPLEDLRFEPAEAADLPGFWASESIDGPMAAVLLRVFYLFGPDGTFTGAALLDEDPPRFVVLSGTWSFDSGMLRLDDAEPARLERAGDRLRLSGADGSVILVDEGHP